jgi:hypothetical protein
LTIQTLNATGAGIQNLAGLEYAVNITTLNLANNALSDLTSLVPLNSVTELHLDGNQLSDISSLSAMTNLEVVTLDNNQITDLSPLAAMADLTSLSFNKNQVADLSPLAGMRRLRTLSFDNNLVSDLSPLARVSSLSTLSFSQNQVVDLSPLSSVHGLIQFSANANLITDISPIASNARLTVINAKENRFCDISALGLLIRLVQVDVSANYLDLTPGSNNSNTIAALVRRGAVVAYNPQYLPPQVVSFTSLSTTPSFTFGKPSTLALALLCPTAPSRPYSGTVTIEDAADTYLATLTVASNGKITWNLAGLTPGTYTCTANYPGDANHLAAQSANFTFTILPASTQTVLQSSASAPVFGQNFALTATVTASTAGTTPRTGTVTFYDGTTLLGTASLDANSKATLPLTASAIGSHQYFASYGGDSNFNASNAKSTTIKVQKDAVGAQPIVVVSPTVAVGQSFTLSVTFAVLTPGAGLPTGLVIFKDNGKILATASLDAGGTAQCTVALTSAGNHKITASYGGDAHDSPAVSAPLLLTVTPAATTTTLASSAPTAHAGTPVIFTVTVARNGPAVGTPIGKIQIKDGTKILATIALTNGIATFSTSTLLFGSHTLTATFLATPNDLTSLDDTTLQIL